MSEGFCGVCGGQLVSIRGRYPKTEKRDICPTCAQERLETINEISSKDYGRAFQDKATPKAKRLRRT